MKVSLVFTFWHRIGLLSPVMLWVAVHLGCALPQDEECERYLSCRASFDAAFALPLADLSDYEATGACWDTPQNASLCRANCVQGTEELRNAAREAGEELSQCQ